ncbi:MAG: aspartate-semialdehyde dehydrogenase [Chloroflexaceae bacterium]|jgi:aspartate-semialdehyde dehydrogenase|nr:aspartate-semialdehyde dehydrogenase [Chloroflexaceae bacterium]
MQKIDVAILGATGMVGQRFIQLLQEHPWFRIAALTGSERTAGRSYGESCRWLLDGEMPASLRDMAVLGSEAELNVPLVFSALPSSAAGPIELRLAAAGHVVCSNASNYRMEPDVPLLIPEVNPEHLGLIEVQRKRRGWRGAIVTNPNCTSTPITMAFRPLLDAFGLRKALVVSMQALSGAGYPGVASYDAMDNVVPYIGGEEPKVESEPQKMLGTLADEGIVPASFATSAHCNRVPVLEGHLECVSVELERKASLDEVIAALRGFQALPQELRLPSAPPQPIIVRDEPDRPQTRRDRDEGRGMATVVGRVRPCSLFDYKFVALAHNTIRGAAGGSILNAELMLAQGIL